jgi:hypothetical protein
VSLGAFAQAASASDQDDVLARARAAIETSKYRDALSLVSPLRKSSDPRTKLEALEIAAVAELESNQSRAGAATVSEIYALAPGFAPSDPSLPDSVTGIFRAEAAKPHQRQVTLRIEPGAESRSLDVHADGAPATVRIACRERGTKAFVPVAAERRGDAFHVRLTSSRTYDCFALAVDSDELPLGRLGSRAEPVEVTPPAPPPMAPVASASVAVNPGAETTAAPPPSKPVTSRWWFWTALGVVVAGGVATVVVAATASHSGDTNENVSHAIVNKLTVGF